MRLALIILLALLTPLAALAGPLIIYQGGGTQPWEPQYAIKIEDGTAILRQYSALVAPSELANADALTVAQVPVSDTKLDQLLASFDKHDFFRQASTDPKQRPAASHAQGAYGTILVKNAKGTYRLSAENQTVPAFNHALFALQKLFPAYPLPIPRTPVAE